MKPKRAILALSCILSGGCAGTGDGERRGRPPNIVILLADDLGFSDLGCYGSEIPTPNLDRLAGNGLRFTQFYNTGRCCPSRASLLTGLYPHQAGVGHMVENRGHPAYRGFLNDRCVTLAEALRPAGYRTLMSGKWHVGNERPHWPVDRGFDRSAALIGSGRHYFMVPPGRTLAVDETAVTPPAEGFYLTDYFSDQAVRFLGEGAREQRPFFLYVAYTAPHWPLHARSEDVARHRKTFARGWDELRERRHRALIESGIVDAAWPRTSRDSRVPAWRDVPHPEWEAERMAAYAGQIECMDRGIGRILGKLRDLGEFENTLILFLSDNGGCSELVTHGGRWLQGDIPKTTADGRPIRIGNDPSVYPGPADTYGSYGIGWAQTSNTPFRLYKSQVHEGGIATPFLAHWPAVIRKGGVVHEPGHLVDLMPTCLEAAGGTHPRTHRGQPLIPLEGKSLVPLFRDRARESHEALFWEHEGNRAVRQGRWKLVAVHSGAWELYDLAADRTEARDLSQEQPQKVRELAALYEGWARRCGVLPWNEMTK